MILPNVIEIRKICEGLSVQNHLGKDLILAEEKLIESY